MTISKTSFAVTKFQSPGYNRGIEQLVRPNWYTRGVSGFSDPSTANRDHTGQNFPQNGK